MSTLDLDQIRAANELDFAAALECRDVAELRLMCGAMSGRLNGVLGMLAHARAEVETMRAVARSNRRHSATLAAIVESVEKAAHVADPEDVTDWQRGYRACSDRVLRAIHAPAAVSTGDGTEPR